MVSFDITPDLMGRQCGERSSKFFGHDIDRLQASTNPRDW
jgi:hypothetical protein